MNRERGVTLVELMVAVALLSLIMAAFFGIFKSGTAAWKKGDTRVELVQNGRIALDRMASEIRQALPKDEDAKPPIYELKVCSVTDTNRVIGSEGDRIIFQASLDNKPDGEPLPEEIRFSRFTISGTETNILYKRVDNPPRYDENGDPIDGTDKGPASSQVTAGPMVTSLKFIEASRPQGVPTKPVLITIKLTLENVEETDENKREQVTLTTKVKVPYAYGKGVSKD